MKNFFFQKKTKLDRRNLLKRGAFILAGLTLAPVTRTAFAKKNSPVKRNAKDRYTPGQAGYKVVHTTCLGCNARCGMRAV